MKKIAIFISIITTISFSSVFAAIETPSARETAIDLQYIFGENQLGLGYNGGELSAALYSDFGTESLRFSVNILELGGSMFNNGSVVDGTTTPWVQGLPKFFVGAGYLLNDTIRFAVGYGGKLSQEKKGSGWYANNAALYFQADIDDYNILKVALPFQYGMGYGSTKRNFLASTGTSTTGTASTYDYKNNNISALVVAPEIRWETEFGFLTQIRLAVPFGMSTIKSQTLSDSELTGSDTSLTGVYYGEDYSSKSLGINLEVFLTFITDPVIFAFVPRIDYKMALDGNYLHTDVFGGNVASNAYTNIAGYDIIKPWQAQLDLAFEISSESDMVYVWAGPALRLMVAGGKEVMVQATGSGSTPGNRKDLFYGLGYALPIEATIRPNSNLEINIGLIGEGSPFTGSPRELEVTVDGSVIWYF